MTGYRFYFEMPERCLRLFFVRPDRLEVVVVMRKLILVIMLLSPSLGFTSGMNSYRLVWDTGKIASFGMGIGYNFFNTRQSEDLKKNKTTIRKSDKVFGPIVEAELGITGYEYSACLKAGKVQSLSKGSYLFTFFAGRSANWIDLRTNIEKEHYILGVRLNYKFIDWAVKYHTDFNEKGKISIQFGIGE